MRLSAPMSLVNFVSVEQLILYSNFSEKLFDFV